MRPAAAENAQCVRIFAETEPASGEWNMAVDAVLLESALTDGVCTLRWYRWDKPTLSLGYFQSAGGPDIDQRFASLPQVRRLSGGGAILHDRELTYSCAIGPTHPLARRPSVLYREIHAAIVKVLNEYGIPIAFRRVAEPILDGSFLCFSRGDANDLVIGRDKVLGSAQRRRRGAVLQHGSLILERSAVTDEFPGIRDFATGLPETDVLQAELLKATALVLGTDQHHAESLTPEETSRVREVVAETRARGAMMRKASIPTGPTQQ